MAKLHADAPKLKYRKQYKGELDWFDVSYDDALRTLLGTYLDNDLTREMLTVVGEIPCMFSVIEVSVA